MHNSARLTVLCRYDSDTDAVYVSFADPPPSDRAAGMPPVDPSRPTVDVDDEGRVLGVVIPDAGTRLPAEMLRAILDAPAAAAPEPVKLRGSAWRAMQARISVVFDALLDHGIVALHEAGQTQEDGFADCAEASEKRGGATGFCFYTQQDAKRAKRTRRLAVAFWGAPAGGPQDMQRVGATVVAAFREQGFAVDWDGTGASRPVVVLDDPARPPGFHPTSGG